MNTQCVLGMGINGQKATYSLHVRRKGIGLTYVSGVIKPDVCGKVEIAVSEIVSLFCRRFVTVVEWEKANVLSCH